MSRAKTTRRIGGLYILEQLDAKGEENMSKVTVLDIREGVIFRLMTGQWYEVKRVEFGPGLAECEPFEMPDIPRDDVEWLWIPLHTILEALQYQDLWTPGGICLHYDDRA